MLNKWSFLVLVALSFALTINLNQPDDYEAQPVPSYITRDNSANNPINNAKATLGRVLFYDKRLSANQTVACATCHRQEFAFSDTALTSMGHDGVMTGRHSMRLINARFAQALTFFWDRRASTLEEQTTMPIKDEHEMGYSGQNGQPNITDLIQLLQGLEYYKSLFQFAYGDTVITETRMKLALANFIRSIQSFDSKFDMGYAQTGNLGAPFPNYTPQENQGKQIFLSPPGAGGAGCQACHRAPEFDIDFQIGNNGVIDVANMPGAVDLSNKRSPTLRDVFGPNGTLNGPLMHSGKFTTMLQAIQHYNHIDENAVNAEIDPHLLGPGGTGQQLNLSMNQMLALEAFLKTLTGTSVYTNPFYSNPFDGNGDIVVIPSTAGLTVLTTEKWMLYPNPVSSQMYWSANDQVLSGLREVIIFNLQGKECCRMRLQVGQRSIDLSTLKSGVYLVDFKGDTGEVIHRSSFRKNE